MIYEIILMSKTMELNIQKRFIRKLLQTPRQDHVQEKSKKVINHCYSKSITLTSILYYNINSFKNKITIPNLY